MYSFVFRGWPPIQCFSVYIVLVRLFSSLAASPVPCVFLCVVSSLFFQLLSSIRFGSFGTASVLLPFFQFFVFDFCFFLCKFSFWSVSLFIEFGNGSERWFVGAACTHTPSVAYRFDVTFSLCKVLIYAHLSVGASPGTIVRYFLPSHFGFNC